MFTKEAAPAPEETVSGGQNQGQIDQHMADLGGKFPKVFTGLGRATGVPDIHIEMDDTVPTVQQKQRQIPIHYKQKLKDHLQELVKEGVVTPLECTNGTGWIHNVVITVEELVHIPYTLGAPQAEHPGHGDPLGEQRAAGEGQGDREGAAGRGPNKG